MNWMYFILSILFFIQAPLKGRVALISHHHHLIFQQTYLLSWIELNRKKGNKTDFQRRHWCVCGQDDYFSPCHVFICDTKTNHGASVICKAMKHFGRVAEKKLMESILLENSAALSSLSTLTAEWRAGLKCRWSFLEVTSYSSTRLSFKEPSVPNDYISHGVLVNVTWNGTSQNARDARTTQRRSTSQRSSGLLRS